MNGAIYHPISFEDYKSIEGVNKHALVGMAQSPAHAACLRFVQDAPSTRRKPVMEFGLLAESLLFGTHLGYVKEAFGTSQTKEAKEWRASQRESGRLIFKDDEITRAKGLVRAVLSNPQAAPFLTAGIAQAALVCNLTLPSGRIVACKGLADWVSSSLPVLADLKTTEDASANWFQKTAWNFRYDVQAEFYCAMYKEITGEEREWAWIVGETNPETLKDPTAGPEHGVAVYRPSEAMRKRAWEDLVSWLEEWGRCEESGIWPDYSSNVQYLDIPNWAKRL